MKYDVFERNEDDGSSSFMSAYVIRKEGLYLCVKTKDGAFFTTIMRLTEFNLPKMGYVEVDND
jgi:hypothetical protein